MKHARRVALMLATDLASSRAILRGISSYVEAGGLQWYSRVGATRTDSLNALLAWKPDGIIAKIYNSRTAQALTRLRLPLVNTTNIASVSLPRVAVDDVAVGKVAAQHFLERGFHHFAYIGFTQQRSPQSRQTGYLDELKKNGFEACCFTHIDLVPFRRGETWGAIDPRFGKWLRTLPKPCGVFAYHDFLAWEVTQVCNTMGLQLPEEIALLGVDDDELFCRLAHPPISSIAYPAERIGFEAARVLDELMRGKRAPRRPILLPPTGVIVRESTDMVATADQDVAGAMRYIRDNLTTALSVRGILREVPISRRTLEQKFRNTLGRSPLAEIRRLRIERAQHYLAGTGLSIFEVSKRCGYSTPERFSAVFRQCTGIAPSQYRQRFGAPSST
jgi:LacI family transcriptional regulator